MYIVDYLYTSQIAISFNQAQKFSNEYFLSFQLLKSSVIGFWGVRELAYIY